jgi:GNAT superfamily N-acetyltransferase
MPNSNASVGHGPLSEGELVQEVERHGEGIDAVSLGEEFEARGYGRHDIQRAIRYALDRGVLELGPRLRLRCRSAA